LLDRQAALDIANQSLVQKTPAGQEWVIFEQGTMEIGSAWIFFYNTKDVFERGQAAEARLAGNGPIFVNKETGEVKYYGTSLPVQALIANYERAH
jgi:hypothetical protein